MKQQRQIGTRLIVKIIAGFVYGRAVYLILFFNESDDGIEKCVCI